MNTTYQDATDFLGSDSNRYFTNGYRHFHWQVSSFRCDADQLSGTLTIRYDGPPRPDGPPHLGSIEYTAIASMLTEYTLVYLFKLDAEQVSLSMLQQVRMKLRKSVALEAQACLPFRCKLGNPEWTFRASNGILSPITIWLGDVEMALVADHPDSRWGRFDPAAVWPLNRPTMYNHGYKLRRNTIADVQCDTSTRTCSAYISRQDYYGGDRQGLFSARPAIIPTDVLSVTGQLMQILLYTLENTTREDCTNIWLRTMSIRYDRAVWKDCYRASIRFLDVNTVPMGGGLWRVVELESQLGTISGKFTIAHRLKRQNTCE